MKKLLALVLALVMTLSLCVTSNAAFADAADIEHDEAVEVMYALGVINGKGDNKFDPKGNVTRAEMAKMISIIMLGDIDAAAFKGTTTDLTDTNGHWAEGFIKYCYSQGVIAGKGNGLFDPNANVTSAEAAKMLLVAIGYNAKVQGYTGADWAINVARDAQISGFYAELKGLTSGKVLTRDEAAQMIYNAVEANTITKVPTITVGTNEVSYTYHANGTPLLNSTFKAYEYKGVMGTEALGDVDYSSTSKKYTYTALGAGNFQDVNNSGAGTSRTTFITDKDYTDLQGEEVMVTFVVSKSGEITVVSMKATGKTAVVNAKLSATESVDGKLKVDGVKYTLEAPLVVGNYVAANSHDTVKLTDTDGNGKYDTAVVTTVVPAKVTYVSATEVIAGGTTYKVEDNHIDEGLAKKDYVTVTKNVDDSYNLVKLEKVTGKVEGYKATKVLVDGTWYNYAATEFVAGNAGKNVEFYAVNGVVVAGTADVINEDTLDNVAMLLEEDVPSSTKPYVKLLFADGSKKVVALDTVSTGALGLGAITPGELYSYTVNDNGYKLKAAATIGDYTWTATSANDVDATGTIDTIGTKGIANDAKIFVYANGGGDGKVITGKAFKTLTVGAAANNIAADSKGFFYGEVGGLDRIVVAGVVAGNATFSAQETASAYALIVESAYKVDDNYITYKIWNGSEVVTVSEKDVSVLGARTQMALIGYAKIEDGVIKDVAAAGETKAAVKGMIGDKVSFDGVNLKDLTGDTVYMYYDSNATEADEIGVKAGELQIATKIEGVAVENVKYILDGTDVKFILVDVKNALKDATVYDVTMTDGATNATVAFTDADGNALTSGDDLKAGAIVNVKITCTAADNVKITFSNAVCSDSTYTSGADIAMVTDQVITKTFVINGNGNASIVVGDGT